MTPRSGWEKSRFYNDLSGARFDWPAHANKWKAEFQAGK
jgi:hypothetical protein